MKKELYTRIYEIEQTHWWYVARRKIVFDWILRILGGYSTPRVLDVGFGTGFNIEYLQRNGYGGVVGLDCSNEALAYARSRGLPFLVCGDGERPPLRHGSFDVVMALDLIEHLDDDVWAMGEFARLLTPGGSLVIFAPAFNFLWGSQDEVSHHRRRYTVCELRRKMEMVGLRIDKLSYTNTFLFPLIWAGRLALRLFGGRAQGLGENDLHPAWSNGLLQAIFSAEGPLLRHVNFPFGVSLLCIARKPGNTPCNISSREDKV
jgi:SAM-dependent methyltransferase